MSNVGKIFVAGHRGMAGAAIVRELARIGGQDVVTRSRAQLDLTDQRAVLEFFAEERPRQVYLAAAHVGGIHANSSYPADFIYQNLMIEANVIHASHQYGVERLLFLGSSCIYPRLANQPMAEEALLTGVLEPTNEPYAIAKIAGIKLCESYNRQFGADYRSVMPTNLYGPGDNYHLANSHVLPAMIRKFHLARLAQEGDIEGIIADEVRNGAIPDDIKSMIGFDSASRVISRRDVVTLWGTGSPFREFLYVEDMAAACVFVMNLERRDYDSVTQPMLSHINVGFGSDLTIREAAAIVANVVGYRGEISFDSTKPDGTPRKLLDSARLNALGWAPRIDLTEGVRLAYQAYLSKEN